ncbi:protein phosphatase 1 regulatory subunit 16A-like isoform X2 [Liolophura sinensis]|uniref:protein phosphatase 1 regulatory subunit 16A-like isoform X2 n=1 Tax=Liolophura sinensis TaxID=3198878 RepID=UPI00315987F3
MTMSEHTELVAEIAYVEKLTPQERLKHAKKRRQQQLKKFGQYEKHLLKEQAKKQKAGLAVSPQPKSSRSVEFVSHVVLLEAASRNDLEEVKMLLQQNVSPDVTNEDGLTALHQCCIDNSEEMLQVLLQYGANVNARDTELWTPLHAAATCGHINLCKYLIDAGAELLAVNADGNMPYDICEDEVTLDYIETEMAKKGVTQEEIDETRISTEKQMLRDLKELFAQGGNLEFTDRSNATPLHIAAANGYIDVAEFLVENHVALDARDEDSWQPIHAAACWCQPEILELLVHHGADIDAKTKNGETPFDICEDPDLKQRILDMKDELETKAANKQREHDQMRRRSRNRRSASIRRTSMREKTMLSLKEAREEAAHFGFVSQPDEDENTQDRTVNGDDEKSVPNSNIDDIVVTIGEDDKPEPITDTRASLHNGESEYMSEESRHVPQDSLYRNGTPQRRHQDVVVTNDDIAPSLPAKQPRQSQVINDARQSLPRDPQRKPPPPNPKPSYLNGDADSLSDTHSLNRRSQIHNPPNNVHESDFNHPGNVNRPGAATVRYPSGVPMGTLADLKKYRAEKSGTLRLRDSANLDTQVQNMFLQTVSYSEHPRDGYSASPKTKPDNRNGHNNSPSSRSSITDRPLRRFTAPGNAQIIGGDDERKQRCCIIM